MKFINVIKKEIAMRQGQGLFEAGDYASARERFALAGSIDSLDAFPYLWLGFCLTELEKYDEAREKYLEAISKSPGNVALKAFLAINDMDQELLDNALQTLAPLSSLSKAPRPVSDAYGLYLLKLGKFDEGFQVLTSQGNQLGVSGVGTRVFTICEEYLSRNISDALELDENIEVEITGSIYSKLSTPIRDFFSTIAFWKRLRRKAYMILTAAERSIAQKDYSKARQLIERVVEKTSDSEIVLSSATLLTRMKDYSKAMAILDCTDDNKKTMKLKLLKILILLRSGKPEGAETLLNSFSGELRNTPQISYLYGLLYITRGLSYRARKEFEKAAKVVNIDMGLDLAALRFREALRVYNLITSTIK